MDGVSHPADGELYYRGYNVKDIIAGIDENSHFGFEECTYLLLFGSLPTKDELKEFTNMLSKYRTLPTSFVRDIIMKAPSRDMMNTLARSVLTLYSYDDRADDISLPNVLRQCLQLISLFPLLSVYGYQAYKHYHDGAPLSVGQYAYGGRRFAAMACRQMHALFALLPYLSAPCHKLRKIYAWQGSGENKFIILPSAKRAHLSRRYVISTDIERHAGCVYVKRPFGASRTIKQYD